MLFLTDLSFLHPEYFFLKMVNYNTKHERQIYKHNYEKTQLFTMFRLFVDSFTQKSESVWRSK